MVNDSINNVIKLICESNAKQTNLEKGSNKQKIGDFFFSGMDTLSIEKLKATPLDEEMKKICGAINHRESFIAGTAERQFMNALLAGCSVPVSALAKVNEVLSGVTIVIS